jgi:hypothetical protein
MRQLLLCACVLTLTACGGGSGGGDGPMGTPDFMAASNASNQGLGAPTAGTLNRPFGVWSDGTRLIVGDWENNRILVYDAFPVASATRPTTVLGQSDFDHGIGNDDDQDNVVDGFGLYGTCTARTIQRLAAGCS